MRAHHVNARPATLMATKDHAIASGRCQSGRSSGGTTESNSMIAPAIRSEEHTSELQSHVNLVCRLLLEKKKVRLQQSGPRARPGAALRIRRAEVHRVDEPEARHVGSGLDRHRATRRARRRRAADPRDVVQGRVYGRLGRVPHHVRAREARLHRPDRLFFFNDTATTEIYTLSLHDALPI